MVKENYKRIPVKEKVCSYCGDTNSNKYGRVRKYGTQIYCGKHLTQLQTFGKLFKRTTKDKNKLIRMKDYLKIELYNSKRKVLGYAKIDFIDEYLAKNHKWCYAPNGGTKYARTRINNKTYNMSRIILNINDSSILVDHKNHNGLDNRRKNLRICNKTQNAQNQKNVKGYSFNNEKNMWESYITINKKRKHLGYFKLETDAKKTRKFAEKKYFGEFANGK